MSNHDFTQRFGFDLAAVRGRIVRLESTWQALLERGEYGPVTAPLLADLAVSAGLLSQDLKVDGSLTIQLHAGHDEAPLRTAVAQCRAQSEIRGIVRGDPAADAALPAPPLAELFRGGQLAITIQPAEGEPYQGRVELDAGDLASHVEAYFARSEQLATRLWLANDGDRAAGLMLQRLPGALHTEEDEDHWRRLTLLADTLEPTELLTLSPQVLLQRLYARDRVRLYPAAPLKFGCSCTRERSASALELLGRDEVTEILAADGEVEVTCQFCGTRYAFDPVDAQLALRGGGDDGGSERAIH